MNAVQSRAKRHVDSVAEVAQIGVQRLGYRQLRGTGCGWRGLVAAARQQGNANRKEAR